MTNKEIRLAARAAKDAARAVRAATLAEKREENSERRQLLECEAEYRRCSTYTLPIWKEQIRSNCQKNPGGPDCIRIHTRDWPVCIPVSLCVSNPVTYGRRPGTYGSSAPSHGTDVPEFP